MSALFWFFPFFLICTFLLPRHCDGLSIDDAQRVQLQMKLQEDQIPPSSSPELILASNVWEHCAPVSIATLLNIFGSSKQWDYYWVDINIPDNINSQILSDYTYQLSLQVSPSLLLGRPNLFLDPQTLPTSEKYFQQVSVGWISSEQCFNMTIPLSFSSSSLYEIQRAEVSSWPVKKMKEWLQENSVDFTGCYDKDELVELVLKKNETLRRHQDELGLSPKTLLFSPHFHLSNNLTNATESFPNLFIGVESGINFISRFSSNTCCLRLAIFASPQHTFDVDIPTFLHRVVSGILTFVSFVISCAIVFPFCYLGFYLVVSYVSSENERERQKEERIQRKRLQEEERRAHKLALKIATQRQRKESERHQYLQNTEILPKLQREEDQRRRLLQERQKEERESQRPEAQRIAKQRALAQHLQKLQNEEAQRRLQERQEAERRAPEVQQRLDVQRREAQKKLQESEKLRKFQREEDQRRCLKERQEAEQKARELHRLEAQRIVVQRKLQEYERQRKHQDTQRLQTLQHEEDQRRHLQECQEAERRGRELQRLAEERIVQRKLQEAERLRNEERRLQEGRQEVERKTAKPSKALETQPIHHWIVGQLGQLDASNQWVDISRLGPALKILGGPQRYGYPTLTSLVKSCAHLGVQTKRTTSSGIAVRMETVSSSSSPITPPRGTTAPSTLGGPSKIETQTSSPPSSASRHQPIPKSLCAICFDSSSDVVLLPCYHLGCCNDCAKKMSLCPFCKGPINDIKRVFDVSVPSSSM